MNLLRTKQWGGWLALFAMVAQLTFSFGHINGAQYHVEGRFLSAAKSLFAHVPVDQYHSHKHHKHHQHNDHQEEEDNCPTCWTVSASGSLVLPVDETISWVSKSVTIPQTRHNTTFVSTIVFPPYQVRAPPVALIV